MAEILVLEVPLKVEQKGRHHAGRLSMISTSGYIAQGSATPLRAAVEIMEQTAGSDCPSYILMDLNKSSISMHR